MGKQLNFWSDGANWFAVYDNKIIGETDVTNKTKDKPPNWFVRITKQYVNERLKKLL